MKYKLTNEWIVGFTDGEGCFHIGITKNKTMKLGYQVIPEFTIVQHIKDLDLLYAIKEYLDCGIVQSNRGKKDKKKKWGERWCYRVRAIEELSEKIIPFFEKNRLLTTKSKDFICFKEVVIMMKQKEHLTLEGLEKIKKVKNMMNRSRDL